MLQSQLRTTGKMNQPSKIGKYRRNEKVWKTKMHRQKKSSWRKETAILAKN